MLTLEERIKRYVNPENPLGPADAHDIDRKEAEVAAQLFDPHNVSFNSLLRKDISVIIGRRGSGKTALLNSYLYRDYLPRFSRSGIHSGTFDFNDYKIILDIKSNKLFDYLKDRDSQAQAVSSSLRPIESVIDDLDEALTQYIMSEILVRQEENIKDDEVLSRVAEHLASSDNKLREEAKNIV